MSGCDEVAGDSVVSWKRHGGPCQHIVSRGESSDGMSTMQHCGTDMMDCL